MFRTTRNLYDWIWCLLRRTRSCDIRFSLQGRYASELDLSPLGITNTAITIPGRALLAGDGITEDEFINTSKQDIEDQMNIFLRTKPHFGPNHLVILDMEPSYKTKNEKDEVITVNFAPDELGRYEGKVRQDGSSMQDALIRAYSLRIAVARAVLLADHPTLKLGLYGVIVPTGKGGKEEEPEFKKRMCAYRRAGERGMYDNVDYLVPVVYTRFGESDAPGDLNKLHDWIEKSTRQAITQSQQLTKHNGMRLPLAPILTFWVPNGNSKHNRKAMSPTTMRFQLQILRSYCSVKILVLWSGKETRKEMESDTEYKFESLDIGNFLKRVSVFPLSDCK